MPTNAQAQPRREDIDLEEAQRFLDLLSPNATFWTFQTFDDHPSRRSARLVRLMHGNLDDCSQTLRRLNEQGAGVFVAVNRTDGTGRRRENITRVRAVTLDLDGASLNVIEQCLLRPHWIIESSPGKYHVYWRVKGLALDRFEDIQRGIARRFDGDPSVALLTHVGRLPGFFHCKGEPFRTRLIEANDLPAYQPDEIIREFPPLQVPHRAPGSHAGQLVLSVDAPMKIAEEFVKRECMTDGAEPPAFCLHYHQGAWYEWVTSHFAKVEEAEIIRQIYNFLDDAFTMRSRVLVPFNPTPQKVNQVLHAMKHCVLLRIGKKPPFWIGRGNRVTAAVLIACRNGLLNIRSGELLPHTPYLFNVNSLPFDYDPEALRPTEWLKFLKQLWPDDKQSRRTLQEIFGLLLTADTSHQRIFLIVGPKRSGKGTIGRVLTELLGKDNVVNPTLKGLASHFGLMPLIDKRAAIISDARLGAQDGNAVAERLLSISGEDAQTIDVKYGAHWSGRLAVRFLLLTNELPRIGDASGALASRFIVLTLRESFYGREDRSLTKRLIRELPGILNWALDGLDRLRDRGHFEMPESSTEAIRVIEDLASPVGAFVRDWCVLGPTQRINIKLAYDAWSRWCEDHGHVPGSSMVFGRNLRAAFPHVCARGAGAHRFYQGLGLSTHGEEMYERLRRAHRYS